MKIIHLTDSMEVGGAERVISLLCRGQRELGHEPSVHCLYSVGALGEELKAEGFPLLLHQAASSIGLMQSLFRRFEAAKPDVVHCHNANATILGAIPARLSGAGRVISTRHGLVERPYPLRRELKFSAASLFCDSVVAVCESAANNLASAPLASRNKITCIRNGSAEINGNSDGLRKTGFTLLNVGRLSAAKDQETLLCAFATARSALRDLQLWIVGDGPLRQGLEQSAAELGITDCVHFYGEQLDVTRFYLAADLFVMSSVTEGLPMALLEAMSAGLPAVVTDVGGMAEVVRLSKAGLIVAPSRPENLAQSIEELAGDAARVRQMRTAARDCYLANFTTDKMISQYLQLYCSPAVRRPISN